MTNNVEITYYNENNECINMIHLLPVRSVLHKYEYSCEQYDDIILDLWVGWRQGRLQKKAQKRYFDNIMLLRKLLQRSIKDKEVTFLYKFNEPYIEQLIFNSWLDYNIEVEEGEALSNSMCYINIYVNNAEDKILSVDIKNSIEFTTITD